MTTTVTVEAYKKLSVPKREEWLRTIYDKLPTKLWKHGSNSDTPGVMYENDDQMFEAFSRLMNSVFVTSKEEAQRNYIEYIQSKKDKHPEDKDKYYNYEEDEDVFNNAIFLYYSIFFPFNKMTFKELNARLDNGEIKKMQQSSKRKIEPEPESEEEVESDATKAKDSTQQSDTKEKPKFGLPSKKFKIGDSDVKEKPKFGLLSKKIGATKDSDVKEKPKFGLPSKKVSEVTKKNPENKIGATKDPDVREKPKLGLQSKVSDVTKEKPKFGLPSKNLSDATKEKPISGGLSRLAAAKAQSISSSSILQAKLLAAKRANGDDDDDDDDEDDDDDDDDDDEDED